MEKPLQKTKKVWKRGKNGLFSWKTEKIQMGNSTSSESQNIQKSKSGSKPKPTVSSERKSKEYFNIQLKQNQLENLVISGAKRSEVSNPGIS